MPGLIPTWASPSNFSLAEGTIDGAAILALCVAAGIGTIFFLPNRREVKVRRLGAALFSAALIILALLIFHSSAGGDVSGTGPYFWIFSAIALAGAIRVVTHPRPVYSALYFIMTVFASAGLFILMYAEFMAAALVLIYAGAILVTYVFVIMLASAAQSSETGAFAGLAECDVVSREPFVSCCIGFALMGVFLYMIFDKAQAIHVIKLPDATALVTGDEAVHGSTQSIGQYLFENQLVNLEVAGLILTVAMVGAIIIARRRVVGEEETNYPEAEMISARFTPLDDSPQSIPVYGTKNPKQKAFPQN
jgi:NADH-quinone oxidoreductase subunit J